MDRRFKCHLIALLFVSGNQFDLLRIGLVKSSDFFPMLVFRSHLSFICFSSGYCLCFCWISDESVWFVDFHSLFLFAFDRILHRIRANISFLSNWNVKMNAHHFFDRHSLTQWKIIRNNHVPMFKWDLFLKMWNFRGRKNDI